MIPAEARPYRHDRSDSVARGRRAATAAYTASKGAVVALTRNIACDLLGTGVA